MAMITLTENAAQQIRYSATQGKMEGMPLRVAVTQNPDNSLHYAMGFDDIPNDKDHKFSSQGIDIVVSNSSMKLLKGTTVDYVELDSGDLQFIFLNPNDPNYTQPADTDSKGSEKR
jgi:iron-sulfur cluster assembly protein